MLSTGEPVVIDIDPLLGEKDFKFFTRKIRGTCISRAESVPLARDKCVART